MTNSSTENPSVEQHFPQRSSCPSVTGGGQRGQVCVAVPPSTAPSTARYLCTKAGQLRPAPAPPRTYQLVHNQGGKLQVIFSPDQETLQMPGPEGPGQLRFLSLLTASSADRHNSRLSRGQRPPHDSSPQRLTPRCLPSAAARAGDAEPPLGGGRRPETPRPGGSHAGGRPPHAAPARREAAAGGPGAGGDG